MTSNSRIVECTYWRRMVKYSNGVESSNVYMYIGVEWWNRRMASNVRTMAASGGIADCRRLAAALNGVE